MLQGKIKSQQIFKILIKSFFFLQRDTPRLLACLANPPIPNRVTMIRDRCPISSELYADILVKNKLRLKFN